MTDEFSRDLASLSRNATKLARYLGDFEGTPETFMAIAVDRIFNELMATILEELNLAIQTNPEYDYPEFRDALFNVFTDPNILEVSRKGIRIRAREIGGREGDLKYGIEAAREALGVGFLDPAKALLFWKERIYRPAREGLQRPRYFKKNLGFYKGAKKGERIAYDYQSYGIMKYKATIEARTSFWGNTAPFWIWLDKGSGGYPPAKPTNFILKAEKKMDTLLQEALIRVADEFSNAVNKEVESFLRNPTGYEAGQELRRFEVGGTQFTVGVTPTGELGIRRTG